MRPPFSRRAPAGRLPAIASILLALALPALASDEAAELFILWGIDGRWDGELSVSGGRLQRVLTYSFEEEHSDRFLGFDGTRASWTSGVKGQFDGLHLFAETGPDTVFHIRTPHGERDLPIAAFPSATDAEVVFVHGKQFLVVGRGNPAAGPKHPPAAFPLPPIHQAPRPVDPVRMPEGWWRKPQALRIALSSEATAPPRVRRVSNGDGRLYLEISPGDGFTGEASFRYGREDLGKRRACVPLWLSLEPRIARLAIDVSAPAAGGGSTNFHLSAPATLVETRKTGLYVNGERFLVKGTLPRDLTDADAAYLKTLGANTLRGWVEPDMAARFGFMLIAMVGTGPSHICAKPLDAPEFHTQADQYIARMRDKARAAADAEHLLIAQLANEQGGAQDPWTGSYGMNFNGRLDYLLARAYNEVKPLCPMAPCGYSNNQLGYRAPRFLEVYEHNTYLWKDRGREWPPIGDFARWQGADPTDGHRPWVMSEWGANIYMPEAWRFGPLLPVLEKIHAWNYPNRWNDYIAAGVSGGTCYCLYDYDIAAARKQVGGEWDKGFSRFGVMTSDRHPKLALWELWHIWRDFAIEPAADRSGLTLRYLRDHSARDCRLTIDCADGRRILDLPDFTGPERRGIPCAGLPQTFRWRLDFTTHGGLPMAAAGAWPAAEEAGDFLARLKPRGTFPFLRELLDAVVTTADGRSDVTTLAEMRREDGVVPVVFKKPGGVAYVTVFHRNRPKNGWHHDGITVDLALSGTVCAVDALTGEPTGQAVAHEVTPAGIRLKNLRVPFWPAGYTSRATEEIAFPVYRVSPERDKP